MDVTGLSQIRTAEVLSKLRVNGLHEKGPSSHQNLGLRVGIPYTDDDESPSIPHELENGNENNDENDLKTLL
jgi:hypothetical protein